MNDRLASLSFGEGKRVRNQLEDVVGKRIPKAFGTIEKKLKNVDLISTDEVKNILPELMNGEPLSEEE